jgi:hypothetical protein
MQVARFLSVAAAGLLSVGCANFDAIRAFAKDGSTVAAAAKKDVDIFTSSCADLRAEGTVLSYAAGASQPRVQPTTCVSVVPASQVVAESLSVQLLVKYHEALNALAGDENWTLAAEIEALGAEVKKAKVDGKSLATQADVDKYQGAFVAIANLVTSALREREARRLLKQKLDWKEALAPLRFWYGGKDGATVSFYSRACQIVRNDWRLVQSELMDYARCDRRTPQGVAICEPLTAGARLHAIDAKVKPVSACAPGAAPSEFPQAAAARVALIDGWIAAQAELREKAFEKDLQSLQGKLADLRKQVDAIKAAFD